MGNCQATDAATLVIQHPSGEVDKLYWPVNASEVMRLNPGHHVALLISTTLCSSSKDNEDCPTKNGATHNTVRLTRIKLLKPTDTLVLGGVYRLITTQDVMKGLAAKKRAKMMKNQSGSTDNNKATGISELEDQATQHEKHRSRTASSTSIGAVGASNTARSRAWQPSLQSISEAAFPAADVSNIFHMKREWSDRQLNQKNIDSLHVKLDSLKVK